MVEQDNVIIILGTHPVHQRRVASHPVDGIFAAVCQCGFVRGYRGFMAEQRATSEAYMHGSTALRVAGVAGEVP